MTAQGKSGTACDGSRGERSVDARHSHHLPLRIRSDRNCPPRYQDRPYIAKLFAPEAVLMRLDEITAGNGS